MVSAAVGAFIPLAPGLSAAHAAKAPEIRGWRIVDLVQQCRYDSLSSVTASGPRDAWAVGVPGGDGPYCGVEVEHWNGTTWRHVRVPRATNLTQPPFEPFAPVAASSGTDAWIFPVQGVLFESQLFAYDYALGWDGASWRKSYFPIRLLVSSAVAFGPKDVWAFGSSLRRQDTRGLYAARYDGRSWHPVKMPGEPLAVTALSRGDIWAVGPSLKTAGKSPARQVIIAMHWTGRRWHTIIVPKITHTVIAQSYLFPAFAAAAGRHDLWWSYPAHGPHGGDEVILVRWRGSHWQRITVPKAISGIDGLAQDGRGGVWLIGEVNANFNLVQYWYHYSGGHWTRQFVPSPRGYSNFLFGIARVPGTSTAWAVGEADASSNTVGVIARYHP